MIGKTKTIWPWQIAAVGVCLLLSVSMILNTQMGGEGVWFWYATLFHNGSRLFSDLHLPLQPFAVLETDAWMRAAGTKCWQFEMLSLVHAALLWLSLGWILKFSDWPPALKAALQAFAFCITITGGSYRLDDYHIISETCVAASVGALLELRRTQTWRGILAFALLCGMFSGISMMTRLNDGVAMLVTSTFCLLVMRKEKRIQAAALVLCSAVLTAALIVRLTGDTYSGWFSNTIAHAARIKGGGDRFLKMPFLLLWNCWGQLYFRLGILSLAIFVALGTRWAAKRWKRGTRFLIWSRIGILLASIFLCTEDFRQSVIRGRMMDVVVLVAVYVTYLVGLIVALRLIRLVRSADSWNTSEILFLIPLAGWTALSASSSGEPLCQYYAPVGLLVLVFAVVVSYSRLSSVFRQEIFCWSTCLVIFACLNKAWVPYAWQNWVSSPMYTHRTMFEHPVRGPLYLDRDVLAFNEDNCRRMNVGQVESARVSLLSLPYPYPNYFCAVAPWHGYVQTYFDTVQPEVLKQMIAELKRDPPEWIIYQRQMLILTGAERLYNHGKPSMQRDIDALLMDKIRSGEWELVKKQDYLAKDSWYTNSVEGDGWYVIRTK